MTVSLTHSTPADGTFSATGATAWNAEHVLTQATARLLGRTTAGTGATEEISVGTGLSLSGGTLTNTVTATAPGGSTTQIQYNNAGVFAGASGLTTNGTELTIASGTKTASAPLLDMSQTWNNAAVTFTGLKLNVTDTASNAASLLFDIGTGGGTYVSRFNIRKDGYITMADSTIAWGTTGLTLTRGSGLNLLISSTVSAGQSGIAIANGTGIAYTASTNAYTSQDLFLTRRAAANLRLGAADAAAPVAQTLSVQSVVAGTTNTAGANLTITGSQGTGTGVGGSIIFQVAPAGSTGTAQNALATTLTLDSVGSVRVVRALTVATLPGTPLAGMIARVTDALAPTIGMTVAGGGAAYALVNYNGANWTVIGV